MKHEKEICYWAKQPDGTKVWRRANDKDSEWKLNLFPKWYETSHYIVDDEWAELRKAQADGKQLQRAAYLCGRNREWIDIEFVIEDTKITELDHWRIKPEELYEYQWIYKLPAGREGMYYISTRYYIDEEEFVNSYPNRSRRKNARDIPVEPYLPSKRIRK